MSFRIEQVNSLIQKDLGVIMSRELELPNSAFVTISRVETNPDLKSSKVFVSILPEDNQEEVLLLLQKNTIRLQQELVKGLSMKFSPKIEFVIDEVEEEAARIEGLLDDISKKDTRNKKQTN
jgi:ribosome-binding factor A